MGRRILGLKIEVSGLENFDCSQNYIFMANHISFLDGPLLFYLIPQQVRVILKKSIFRIPVVGAGMRFAGFIPVDRKRARGGKKSIDEAARLMKEKGYSFLIFPEGTRSRDGRIQSFKRGGFFLAIEAQAPILPITIKGTFELMPKGSFFVKRGVVRVVFHPPIKTAGMGLEDMPALMQQIREAIIGPL